MNKFNYKFSIVLTILLIFSMKGFAQFSGGAGTAEDPYIISTKEDLSLFATYVNTWAEYGKYINKCYKLANDIDISGINWDPVGNYNNPFSGVFDGDNKVIKGLTIDADLRYAGLFGSTTGVTIKNLGVTDINMKVTCGNYYVYVGGVVGSTGNTNAIIDNCYSTGSINVSVNTNFSLTVAGIVGYYSKFVSNCYSSVSITASSTNGLCAGGVAGGCEVYYGNLCTVSDCYFTGTLNTSCKGTNTTGGVVGGISGWGCSITNCYSTGSIYASQNTDMIAWVNAGGILGDNSQGSVSKCYSSGSVTAYSEHVTGGASASATARAGGILGSGGSVSNCYSTAAVTASANSPMTPNAVGGGIVGGGGDVSNCYSTGLINATTAGSSISSTSTGGIVGSKSANGNTTNCAGLNSALICNGGANKDFGRVVGYRDNLLSNNIGFANMINPNGEIIWNNIAHDKLDGASITIAEILADGTLGGRFTAPDWIVENGKLPGLGIFGNVVDLPPHLGGVGVVETHNCASLRVYPNPTTGELRIDNGELKIENVEVYDVYGKKISSHHLIPSSSHHLITSSSHQINISHLPSGIYFLKIGNETVKLMKY